MKKIAFFISFFVVVVFVFAFSVFFEMRFSELGSSQIEKNDVEVSDDFDKAKVLFVGDMMFDRWIRQVTKQKGIDFVFEDVEGVLKESDLVVGNLEGPITSSKSVSVGTELGSRENYVFTFPPETASDLNEKNIRLVNLGNNHIFNFGNDGLNETKKYLSEASVDFFGDGFSLEGKFAIKEINGIKIAFLSHNQFIGSKADRILNDLERVREFNPDFVVLYAHWGKEYEGEVSKEVVDLAHRIIDDGVDLIIGSHSHVIGPKEEYKGKMIYYSLGNFVFDQYFDSKTTRGMVVEVEFDSNKEMKFVERFVEMKPSGKTVLID